VRTFCSATNNTATTTTQQRRNRDAQKDKTRASKTRPGSSTTATTTVDENDDTIRRLSFIHSSTTYVPFIQQYPPISLVSRSTGRVGARESELDECNSFIHPFPPSPRTKSALEFSSFQIFFPETFFEKNFRKFFSNFLFLSIFLKNKNHFVVSGGWRQKLSSTFLPN
jgi:hypothetical protein